MKTKSKAPTELEVMDALKLGEDLRLASLLVDWYKARRLWRANKDGRAENKAMGATISAIDERLADDPERKMRLMNEMINQFS